MLRRVDKKVVLLDIVKINKLNDVAAVKYVEVGCGQVAVLHIRLFSFYIQIILWRLF